MNKSIVVKDTSVITQPFRRWPWLLLASAVVLSALYLLVFRNKSEDSAVSISVIMISSVVIIAFAVITVLLARHFKHQSKSQIQAFLQQLEEEKFKLESLTEQHQRLLQEIDDIVKQRTLNLLEANQQLARELESRNREIQAHSNSDSQYRTLFERSADPFLIIANGRIADCNQSTIDLLGYKEKSQIIMCHLADLSPSHQSDHRESREKAEELITIALNKGSHRFEWEYKKASNEVFPVAVSLTAIPSEHDQILHAVWRDITDRKRAEAELQYRAYYDLLTGLPNRQLLYDRLKQSLAQCRRHQQRGAMVMIDIDNFKTINDSLGHSMGDGLLRSIADSLRKNLREEDTICRMGGDEFVILISPLNTDNRSELAATELVVENIKNAFALPFGVNLFDLHATPSVGISLFPYQNETADDILKHAETAMYNAKKKGPNNIEYYLPSMGQAVTKRLNLEKDLRKALDRNELFLCYQPQVNHDGALKSVETLVRWQHPEKGLISPADFIPIAEDTNLIIPMGEWILNQSISDILEINQGVKPVDEIRLSVNVSPVQFRQADFVDQIKSLKENYHLPENFLTLEITENIVIESLDSTTEKLAALHELGIKTSLDDFGTGYSSLSYLKQLPIHELKIDQTFVKDIEKDENDAVLVSSIIAIGHQFGLEIVAEGVETRAQVEFMASRRCHLYQGFFFSKPLPLDNLKHYIAGTDNAHSVNF